jgi:hypothetical protein
MSQSAVSPALKPRRWTPLRIGVVIIATTLATLVGVIVWAIASVKSDPSLAPAAALPSATVAPATPAKTIAAAPTHSAPQPPLTAVVQRHLQCPHGAGFCAMFPYFQPADFSRMTVEATTAKKHRAVAYSSRVHATTYPIDDMHGCVTPLSRRCSSPYYCVSSHDLRCQEGITAVERWHYVEILDSRYDQPCAALHALFDGPARRAPCLKEYGYYTVHFAFAHNPVMALYAHHRVYIVSAGSTNDTPSPLAEEFLKSFVLVN